MVIVPSTLPWCIYIHIYIHIVHVLHTALVLDDPSHSLLDHHSSPRKSNIALRTPQAKEITPYHLPPYLQQSINHLPLHPPKKYRHLPQKYKHSKNKNPQKPKPYPIPPFLNKKQKTYPQGAVTFQLEKKKKNHLGGFLSRLDPLRQRSGCLAVLGLCLPSDEHLLPT